MYRPLNRSVRMGLIESNLWSWPGVGGVNPFTEVAAGPTLYRPDQYDRSWGTLINKSGILGGPRRIRTASFVRLPAARWGGEGRAGRGSQHGGEKLRLTGLFLHFLRIFLNVDRRGNSR